ncbi:MAG: hypothetical protein J6O04_12660 [Selenomonadaceae bacterium]|nr:hypothetical protein [Selenomonadaceae bacterium]
MKKILMLCAALIMLMGSVCSASTPYFYATDENSIKAIADDVNTRLPSDCKLYVYELKSSSHCKALFGNSKSNKFVARTEKYVNCLNSIDISCSSKEDSDKFRKIVSATMSTIMHSKWESSGMKQNFEKAFWSTNKDLPYTKTFTANYASDLLDIVLEYNVSSSLVQNVKIRTKWVKGR